MYKIKSLVKGVGVLVRRIASQNVDINATTLNDLPEEIIAKILAGIPKNEIPNFRSISRSFNSSITAWFGRTLTIKGSRQDFPESLREGQVTILKLKDCVSLNPHDGLPLSRLRELEIGGEMRLQTLVCILGESPNLRKINFKFPKVSFLDFDNTLAPIFNELPRALPARIETLEIIFEPSDSAKWRETTLLQILSQLPLNSLKKFSCIYANSEEELLTDPMESYNNLSSLIKTILTKCRWSLRVLSLSRPYDWLEAPESTPIEKEFNLKTLRLLWVGESRWLRSLIDAQRTRSGLESLIISCYEDLWVQGVVQEVALASKATLKIFAVNLHLKVDQIINEELNLGFLGHLSKLERFFIKSKRGFIKSQGRRTLEEPLAPLILPQTLKEVVLNAPITFQTLQSFSALPALEEFTLEGFKWVDWPTVEAIQGYMDVVKNGRPVNLEPAILLNWRWLRNLLRDCPSLKFIEFSKCVLDFGAFLAHTFHLAKIGAFIDFDLEQDPYLILNLAALIENLPAIPDNIHDKILFTSTVSLTLPSTNRPSTFIDACKSILKSFHCIGSSKKYKPSVHFI